MVLPGFGEFEVTDDINSLQWWVDGESGCRSSECNLPSHVRQKLDGCVWLSYDSFRLILLPGQVILLLSKADCHDASNEDLYAAASPSEVRRSKVDVAPL